MLIPSITWEVSAISKREQERGRRGAAGDSQVKAWQVGKEVHSSWQDSGEGWWKEISAIPSWDHVFPAWGEKIWIFGEKKRENIPKY